MWCGKYKIVAKRDLIKHKEVLSGTFLCVRYIKLKKNDLINININTLSNMSLCGICEQPLGDNKIFACGKGHVYCIVCFSNYAVTEASRGNSIYNLKCMSEEICDSIFAIDESLPITNIIKNNNSLQTEKIIKNEKHISCLCGRIIQKLDGPECNHLTCVCERHYCWTCKKHFNTSADVYEHFNISTCKQYDTSFKIDIIEPTVVLIANPVPGRRERRRLNIRCDCISVVDSICDFLSILAEIIIYMLKQFFMFGVLFVMVWVPVFLACILIWIFLGKPEGDGITPTIVMFSIPSCIAFILACCGSIIHCCV